MAFTARAQSVDFSYGMDSFNDGHGLLFGGGYGVGENSQFELFGMAYAESEDEVFFAFTSNMPSQGVNYSGAADGHVGWGDLFINLNPSQGMDEAQGQDSLYGIRFSWTNDSGLDDMGDTLAGVYKKVTTGDVTAVNGGYSNYNTYQNQVTNKGGTVEYIDGMSNSQAKDYLGGAALHGHSVITSGEKVGGIDMLTDSELAALGLDFAGEGGFGDTGANTVTFGFKFARSLLPGGELNWVAHIIEECANDSMGMSGTFQAYNPPPGGGDGPDQPIPEPF
jgi:hypothetical protein